jgi:fructose-1,6-bisphosphatase II
MNSYPTFFYATDDKKPLYMHALSATTRAAIACANWIGKNDVMAADAAAVEAMRSEFENIPIAGRIIIGEGERDEAPMLYIGEEVGCGGFAVDIAVDPLEGTSICAKGLPDSLSVIAMAPSGTMLHAPDVYMQKIVAGPEIPADAVDLDWPVEINLKNAADALNIPVKDLIVTVLNRPRHQQLMRDINNVGAKLNLIEDGDVQAAIACCMDIIKTHVYMGIGGAPEGVLAAAALKCLGGSMQGRLIFANKDQEIRAKSMGIDDLNFKYNINSMVSAEAIFVATGVTTGELVDGVSHIHGIYTTHSIVLNSNVPETLRITKYFSDRA